MKPTFKLTTAGLVLCMILPVQVVSLHAAELKCLCTVAMTAMLGDLIPQFERSSGHQVTVDYGTVAALTNRVQSGEVADVVIVSGQQIDDLQKQGKVVSGSRVDVARVGYGVFVRSGAPKPDISSVDAFRRSLLAAQSIAYDNPAGGSPAGIYLSNLVERLGLATELKSKTKLLPVGGGSLQAVAKGEIEIAFSATSNIATDLGRGLDLVGPLPPEIQSYTLYAAGIVATGKQPEAGRALIAFMLSPSANEIMKAKGFEPR
jgi:molybdate transport system substrate-binding protein